MFEEATFRFKLRKLQSSRDKTVADYRREWQKIRAQKGGRDERDRLRASEEIDLREVDADIEMLITQHMLEQARRFIVPVPAQSDDSSWVLSDTYGHWYLTPSAVQKIRSDIRAEKKANWEFWQTRVTLVLALVGSIFGVLAFFRK